MMLGKVLLFLYNNRKNGLVKTGIEHINVGSCGPHRRVEAHWRKNDFGSCPTYPFPKPHLGTLSIHWDSGIINWPVSQSQTFHLWNRVNNDCRMVLTRGLKSILSKAPSGASTWAWGCWTFFFYLLPQNLIFLISIWGPMRLEESYAHSRDRAPML